MSLHVKARRFRYYLKKVWLYTWFPIGLLVVILVRHYVGEICIVDTPSMHPTITPSELMFYEKWSYWTRTPRPGEVVAFYPYENKYDMFVKRVDHVYRKGDTLKLTDTTKNIILAMARMDGKTVLYRRNRFYVDGKPCTYYVPEQDYYYMLGDNSNNSYDSRYWGYIPESAIIGRMRLILFSWDHEAVWWKKIRWGRMFRKVK